MFYWQVRSFRGNGEPVGGLQGAAAFFNFHPGLLFPDM